MNDMKALYEEVGCKEKFDIIPLMYGSLGLEYITGNSLDVDDIDILIPEIFLNEQWSEFKEFLTERGYILFDEHEHTFQKDDVFYSYASVEELETFSGINISDIRLATNDDVRFRLLSLEPTISLINIRKTPMPSSDTSVWVSTRLSW